MTKCISRYLLILATVVAVQPVAAVEANRAGELSVHVAISNDPRFVDDWIRTAPSPGVTIRRIREVQIGDVAHIGFIVTGHRVSATGIPNIEIDVIVRTPNGAILMAQKAYARVRYKTGEGGFIMADPAMDIKFELGDPAGLWRIEATARDRIAKTTAIGFATLEVKQ